MGTTRRTILGSAVAVGASMSGFARSATRNSNSEGDKMNNAERIDVHQHLLPPEFLAALDRHGLSAWKAATWSSEGALAMMDAEGIATGILSLSAPGANMGDDADARALAKQVNERQAALVQQRPDRFGMFACLPLPDVDGSLEAIRHAYDDLSTDGVIILANSRGVYAGDPAFDPVMEELNRRNAVILIHPTALPGPPIPGIHPAVADFLLDTTRAAVNMAQRGTLRRYPKLKIILSHAGGFVPFAAHRLAVNIQVTHPSVDMATVLEDMSNFYFDTAMSGSPTALPSLMAFANPSRVLFGSDSPYCSNQTVDYFTKHLDAYRPEDRAMHHAINRGNGELLFPRLAKKSAMPSRRG